MTKVDNKRLWHYVSMPQIVLTRIDDPSFKLQQALEPKRKRNTVTKEIVPTNMAKAVNSPLVPKNTKTKNTKGASTSPKIVLRNRLNNAKLKSKYSLKASRKASPKNPFPKGTVGQKGTKAHLGKQTSPGLKRSLKNEPTVFKSGKLSIVSAVQKKKPKTKASILQVIQAPAKLSPVPVAKPKQKLINTSKAEIKLKPTPKQQKLSEKRLSQASTGIAEVSVNKTLISNEPLSRIGGKRLSQDIKDGALSKKIKYCLNDDWDVEAMVKELHDESPSPPPQKKQVSFPQSLTTVQTDKVTGQSFDENSEAPNLDSDPIYDKLIQALSTNSVARQSVQSRAHTNKGIVVKKKVIGGSTQKVKTVHKNNTPLRPKTENLLVKSVEAINSKAENELVTKTSVPKAEIYKKTAKVEPLAPPMPQLNLNVSTKKSSAKQSGNKEEPVNLLSKLVGVAISPSEMQILPISKAKSKKQATLNQVTITKVKAAPKTQLVSPTQKPTVKTPEMIGDINTYEENANNKEKGISRIREQFTQKMMDEDNIYLNDDEMVQFESEDMSQVELEPRTIYDMMQEVSLCYPSWNLHIMPDTNTFCIAQVTRGRLGMPVLNKSIELDAEFNAKVYVHQLHCKRFDGKYDSEETIMALIDDINILAV